MNWRMTPSPPVRATDPASGHQVAGDDPQQRRLAGAVLADQRGAGAVADAEVDVVQQHPPVRKGVPDTADVDVAHPDILPARGKEIRRRGSDQRAPAAAGGPGARPARAARRAASPRSSSRQVRTTSGDRPCPSSGNSAESRVDGGTDGQIGRRSGRSGQRHGRSSVRVPPVAAAMTVPPRGPPDARPRRFRARTHTVTGAAPELQGPRSLARVRPRVGVVPCRGRGDGVAHQRARARRRRPCPAR